MCTQHYKEIIPPKLTVGAGLSWRREAMWQGSPSHGHPLGRDHWQSLSQQRGVWHRREPCSSACISLNLLFKQITSVYVDF